MKKLIIVLVVLLALVIACANSEGVMFQSDGMRLSEFPQDLFLADVCRVDISGEELEGTLIHPPDLAGIALTDGTHIAWAYFEWAGDNIWFHFNPVEIRRFDGTMGLWLITLRR